MCGHTEQGGSPRPPPLLWYTFSKEPLFEFAFVFTIRLSFEQWVQDFSVEAFMEKQIAHCCIMDWALSFWLKWTLLFSVVDLLKIAVL